MGNKISGADNTANSTPQNISCESGSCTEQDDADWLSSGGARDYGLLKTATNKTVRFVKYHLPMRLNLLLVSISVGYVQGKACKSITTLWCPTNVVKRCVPRVNIIFAWPK